MQLTKKRFARAESKGPGSQERRLRVDRVIVESPGRNDEPKWLTSRWPWTPSNSAPKACGRILAVTGKSSFLLRFRTVSAGSSVEGLGYSAERSPLIVSHASHRAEASSLPYARSCDANDESHGQC
jgi:hypothetical protein